jgi:SAM-dependent methyltransferase
MLDYRIQQDDEIQSTNTILDLGCGNGRNSLYLAKKFNSTNVVLVDSDFNMLDWAQKLFSNEGPPVKVVNASIEELGGNQSKFDEAVSSSPFDIIIFSYVIQHIDPVYYPIIFDFCRHISKKYLVIDIFWNPSRLGPGEFTKIGTVNWYGLTYDELVSLVAPRFQILDERIHQTDVSFMVNMLMTEGKTSLKSVFDRNYEYNPYIIRVRRSSKIRVRTTKNRIKSIDIRELECIEFLSSYYPTEMDCVKAEFSQWMEESNRIITPALVAAKVLWLCRINKIPLMLKEISRGFRIRTKNIMHLQSEIDYIPSIRYSRFYWKAVIAT